MLSWIDAIMKQEQYNDLLREAEKRALERCESPALANKVVCDFR